VVFALKGGVKMSLRINGYNFESDYSITGTFNNVAGVYIIYYNNTFSNRVVILDVGETESLGRRIANHERKIDWINKSNGYPIKLAFRHVSNSTDRLLLERSLRLTVNPLCGER
jgi:hypothetical protein